MTVTEITAFPCENLVRSLVLSLGSLPDLWLTHLLTGGLAHLINVLISALGATNIV